MTFQEFKLQSQGVKEAKIQVSGFMYRFQRSVSLFISWGLVRAFPNIVPNYVSALNILLILFILVFSIAALFIHPFVVICIQFILMVVSSVLDKVDGELARVRKFFTQRGIYYDLVYHFLYTFTFYFCTGFFFSGILGSVPIMIFSVTLALLGTCYKMAGKLRHHVRFKIILENHENEVLDAGRVTVSSKNFIQKAVHYSIFMIYDWAWIWYVTLVLISWIVPLEALFIYFMHTVVACLIIIYELIFKYPKESLYLQEELTKN